MRKSLFHAVTAIAGALAEVVGCSSSSTNANPVDAGAGDAQSPKNATPDSSAPDSAAADAGTPLCTTATYAACAAFEDRSAAGADRKVTFKDFEYAPKCMRIKAGQTVVFEGDFERHPLVTACGPALAMDKRTGSGSAPFVLVAPGLYGLYCLDHGNAAGEVMAGAIDVVP